MSPVSLWLLGWVVSGVLVECQLLGGGGKHTPVTQAFFFQIKVTGWACDFGVNRSTDVHIYRFDGPTGSGGVFVGSAKADGSPTRTDISAACGTKGVGHMFRFTVNRTVLASAPNQWLSAVGLSLTGGVNNQGQRRVQLPAGPMYRLSERYVAGADLVVNAGERVIIDRSFSGPAASLGTVTVNGRLECPLDMGTYTIGARALIVTGVNATFECGTAASPFLGSFELEMHVGTTPPPGLYGMTPVAAANGGTISMHGDGVGGEWVRLAAHAAPGATSITVSKPLNWRVGDRVIVGPTRFNYLEAESRIVQSVSGNTVTFTVPLTFPHFGLTQTYSRPGPVPAARSWTLDSRAEVGNLHRNIRVRSVGAVNKQGAHMIVRAGGRAFLDGVALIEMGQLGQMGRYSFHWHFVGDATEQYIKNSAIVDPFQVSGVPSPQMLALIFSSFP
jgi:hypothetical protein